MHDISASLSLTLSLHKTTPQPSLQASHCQPMSLSNYNHPWSARSWRETCSSPARSAEGLFPAGGVLRRADRTDEDAACGSPSTLHREPTGGGSLVNQLLTSSDRTANITSCVSDTPWVATRGQVGTSSSDLKLQIICFAKFWKIIN